MSDPLVNLVSLDADLGFDSASVAADFGLRDADATYVAVAHRYNLPLLTWDREQAERASAIIMVRTPDS